MAELKGEGAESGRLWWGEELRRGGRGEGRALEREGSETGRALVLVLCRSSWEGVIRYW